MILGGRTSEPGSPTGASDEALRARIHAAKVSSDLADERATRAEATARTARDVARRLKKHHDDLLLELQGQLTIDEAIGDAPD